MHHGIPDPVVVVQQMLHLVTQPTCPRLGFALRDLEPSLRKDEWSFLLGTKYVDLHRIGRILAKSSNSLVADLGKKLARQEGRDAEHRFLVGKVDLMCSHEDRWWVFDWKSNHLGNARENYEAGRLAQSMVDEKYVVQYHLYLAGLHSHLQARCGKAYDYGRHVGGACYVYLRGLDEGAQTGWYVDKPEHAVIDELARTLRQRGEDR